MNGLERRAFSLLEVLLATSIFLGCVIVLGHLAAIGSRRARVAEDLSMAEILCQSEMAQRLSGAEPLEPVAKVPLADQPDWLLSVELEPTDVPELTALRVTVTQDMPDDQDKRARTFSLVRWVRNRVPADTGDSAEPVSSTETASPTASSPEPTQ